MNGHFRSKLFILGICCAALSALAPSAYAADVTTLEDNQTHAVGDLTGDGVADEVKVLLNEDGNGYFHNQVKIYVNNRLMLNEESPASTWGVRCLNFDNGKSALYLIWGQGSRMMRYHGLFDFPSNDRMHQLADFYRLYPIGSGMNSGCSIKGNGVTVSIYQHGFTGSPPFHDDLTYKVKFKWSGDRFIRASNTCDVKTSWSATPYYSYKLYRSPGSKKVITTVKKNAKVKGVSIRFVGKKCYMKIKTKSGKTGWHVVS